MILNLEKIEKVTQVYCKNNLKILGFDINIIQPVTSNHNLKYIHHHELEKLLKMVIWRRANLFLGRNWSMKGTIIEGDKRAGAMNFPTANIVPGELIHPKKGVYAIRAEIH